MIESLATQNHRTTMRRLAVCHTLVLFTLVRADTTRLGIYMMGSRIGSSVYSDRQDQLNGQAVKRTDSTTKMDAALLGQSVQIHIDSTSWTDLQGRPLKMTFDMQSAGRSQKVEATFGSSDATVSVDNSGSKSTKVIPIPKGAPIVDDPLTEMLTNKSKRGAALSFYVLDPTTVSFIKNIATLKGDATTNVHGKDIKAQLVEIEDPRATLRVFVSSNGDLIKVDGPMGMEMYPETEAVASAPPPTTPIDLASISSLGSDIPVTDPNALTELKIKITGHDLSKIPSDDHQTTSLEGDSWIVDIHPPRLDATSGLTIKEAGKQMKSWTRPSLDIPSDSPTFRELAHKIVGKKTRVKDASLAVKNYVHKVMTPNAGIGVVRDAKEVLATKEGVCRDYAILTTTLLRAQGIPARLASGLESFGGRFYYHAWAEAWDGKRWLGIDSTVVEQQISAGHVKLASGSVEDAFTFPVLDKVKIQVLAQRHLMGN